MGLKGHLHFNFYHEDHEDPEERRYTKTCWSHRHYYFRFQKGSWFITVVKFRSSKFSTIREISHNGNYQAFKNYLLSKKDGFRGGLCLQYNFIGICSFWFWIFPYSLKRGLKFYLFYTTIYCRLLFYWSDWSIKCIHVLVKF